MSYQQTSLFSSFMGCDISKDTIAIYLSDRGEELTIANTAKTIQTCLKKYGSQEMLIICEATGGYEACLLEASVALGIPAHRADAAKVKAFIRSFGTMGKTDAIDARALALYGQERQQKLDLWTPRSANRVKLQQLVARRDDLVQMRSAEKNRLKAPDNLNVKASIRAVIKALTTQIDKLDHAIVCLVDQCVELKQIRSILVEQKGIGQQTAAQLLAQMPELGTLTRRQAASLAGLAPHPRDSGQAKGHRTMRGGRKQLRPALFMAAMSAARTNPVLKSFYQRLVENGKKPKVALGAVMRKIIVILNAKVRDQYYQNLQS